MGPAAGFELHAVAHLTRPWGQPARDLQGLRDGLAAAPPEVLFHHTVQFQLRHPAAEELPPDDLSAWVGGVVQDAACAERLSFVVQSRGGSGEQVRAGLLEVLDAIPERRRLADDAPEGGEFLFLASHAVAFPIGVAATDTASLVDALLGSDPSVWFRHLLSEPWWLGRRAPLIEWVAGRGDERLAGWLAEDAASGLPIDRARGRLARRWRQSRIARSLAESAGRREDERREAGRDAIERLVRHRRDGRREG